MFKRKNIKTGMFVITRDKELRIVLGKTLMSVSGRRGGIPVSYYTKKLKDKGNEKNDIMEIYSEPGGTIPGTFQYFVAEELIIPRCKKLWIRN